MSSLSRVPAGRLNGISAPVGTVLGPKEVTREFVVVTAVDDLGVSVGYATQADLDAVLIREPQSLCEVVAHQGNTYRERLSLRLLFGMTSE